MDKYIKCLMDINETAKESDIADFEFSESREAIIFSQWMGAILPIDEKRWFHLPNELGWCDEKGDFYPLLSESMVSLDVGLLQRRFVRFITPLKKVSRYLGQNIEEFDDYAYSQEVNKIIKEGVNPQSFILVELNRQIHPKYDEHFWEYIAGCNFRKSGYLITFWTPNGLPGGGCPDMGAYKAPPILNPLRRHKFVKEGCFLLELELPLTFGHATENPAVDDIDSYSVVVEAKSQSSDEKAAVDQLVSRGGKGGYLQWGHFDEGYITGPDFDGKEHKYGTISNKPDGQLLLVPYRRNRTCSIPETKERTLRQLEQIVKQALIKNIPIQRLLGFCTDKPLNKIGFRGFLNELSLALERMTVDEVCSFVREKD